MSNPLGPFLADVFMGYVENLVEDPIRKMAMHKRYVDDITEDKGEDINRLLEEFNRSQKHISLTCEEEKNNQLPLLDILISRRDDGSIRRSIYRKPTWTGQYPNFHSHCPIHYKRGLMKSLFNRINRICTSDTNEVETKLLTDTLLNNGFSLKFINRWKGCNND
ncbi:unnamed protein product [Schistosoma mattheei]|uniref:Helix-turn-helix domain-containing protein n=1 Tax=Schistosoma mattheei TaxID=31246 RepID=A0A183PAT5_9TREM|nr:unnamed protein product [Schistosoma mattheei]